MLGRKETHKAHKVTAFLQPGSERILREKNYRLMISHSDTCYRHYNKCKRGHKEIMRIFKIGCQGSLCDNVIFKLSPEEKEGT